MMITHPCRIHFLHGFDGSFDVPIVCTQIFQQKQVVRLKVNVFDCCTFSATQRTQNISLLNVTAHMCLVENEMVLFDSIFFFVIVAFIKQIDHHLYSLAIRHLISLIDSSSDSVNFQLLLLMALGSLFYWSFCR